MNASLLRTMTAMVLGLSAASALAQTSGASLSDASSIQESGKKPAASPSQQSVPSAVTATPVQNGSTDQKADAGKSDDLPLNLLDPDKKLHIAFTPYIWLTGISGTMGVNNINMNASANFTDILSKTNGVFGLMGDVDMEVDRFVCQIDAAWAYMKVDNSRGIFRTGTVSAEMKTQTAWIELMGGYRILDELISKDKKSNDRLFVDGFAGARCTTLYLDTTVTATAAVVLPDGTPLALGASRQITGYQDWWEPFVGARMGLMLDDRWLFVLRGDVGGFGASGDSFSWQAIGMVGYNWHMDGWNLSLLGGFRALSQDYTNGGFRWNETVYGPALGVQFSFAF